MAVLATAVWRVRPSGVNTNGGGYDAGIAGAGTDYSQQNSPQASGTNGSTTGAGATTFTDSTAGAFTSAMVGNCIQIASGTNFQAGFYFVVTFTNANSVVLDRTPSSGGAGSAGVWKLGGGWADFWTFGVSTGPLVAGNIVYILGTVVPDPASYGTPNYTYSGAGSLTFASGSATGKIAYLNDPLTPSYAAPPITTGGMPTIKLSPSASAFVTVGDYLRFEGLWFIGSGVPRNYAIFDHVSYHSYVGCVVDQLSDALGLTLSFNSFVGGCEIFSSTAPISGGQGPLELRTGSMADGCNIHDANGPGILIQSGDGVVANCIIAKCTGSGASGISCTNVTDVKIFNNTIDGNAGNGIDFTLGANRMAVFNNIISNHTGGGKVGLLFATNTAAQNYKAKTFVDYNTFYNNTANYSGISAGAHDVVAGSSPYTASSTEDYSLA